MKVRAALGLLVLGLAAWALVAIFVAPQTHAAPTTFTSSQECASCHAAQFSEWKSSWHAQAWTDVEVRKLSNDFSNADCIDCHAPQSIFETGVGNRVLPRTTRQVEGVDCISCHVMQDGRVAGTVDNPNVACRPVAQRELIKPEFCAACHDQHDTVKQWKASRYAQPGDGFKDCLACHMPYRNGDPAQGREHVLHGGHNIELVKSAITFKAFRVDGKATVEVENVAAGHNFPTDERSRAADIFWRPIRPAGEANPWRHLYRFRNPYRYEVALPNTELAAGAKVTLPIDDAEATGEIDTAIFFRTTPYWADPAHPDPENESTLLYSARLQP